MIALEDRQWKTGAGDRFPCLPGDSQKGASMAILRITLFGKATVRLDDMSLADMPAKAQELLFYLLLHRTQPHTREALAGTLWGSASATLARKYLRKCLWQLQQMLELPGRFPVPLLDLDGEWVGIHPDALLQVDAQQFNQAFVLVRDLDGATLTPEQVQAARMAAALYHGDLLRGWYQDWCLVERERYQSMFFALLDKLMDYCLAQSLFDEGIAYGMGLLQLEYTRESTHRRLMRLYHGAHDRTAALRQFTLCAAALEKEFGISPSEETITLFEQMRAGQTDALYREHLSDHAPVIELASIGQMMNELATVRRLMARLQQDVDHLKQGLRPER